MTSVGDPAGPLVASSLWAAVMDRAGYRCQCAGECGRTHRKRADRRCVAEHSAYCRLHAAPPEPVGYVTDAALPVEALHAYCPECHAGVARAARRAADPPASAARRAADPPASAARRAADPPASAALF
jgi:hypothetical protein